MIKDAINSDIKDVIVKYIRTEYAVEPEMPWNDSPQSMTFKEKYSKKWFALIMPVRRGQLLKNAGPDSGDPDELIYIMNVKADTDVIMFMSNQNGFMPGYHMNKMHWLTVFLDGSVSVEQIRQQIDNSFYIISNTPTRRIYEAVKKIPEGKVATYGQVAQMAGDKNMARAVGNALHKNPDPENIPCFRVVNSKGELAGEFAFGGSGAQAKLLKKEGVIVENGRVDLKKYGIII